MNKEILSASVLTSYPAVDESALNDLLLKELENQQIKLVVLDDDPTGVQTVHDVNVYTNWSQESMDRAFAEENRLFYILTNSRGMTAAETTKIHKEIMETVSAAAKKTGKRYLYISRSDSTLRGHYPLETQLLKEGLKQEGIEVDGEVLIPFFKEGGRFTIGNVHYVKYGDELVPAAQTEFAKDKTFGYSHSDIPSYIEEKTKGAYKASDVTCIPLELLRSQNLDAVEELLLSVKDFGKVCVNAVDYCDMKAFVIALYRAMGKGKHFMFRTAAGFVKVAGGISDQPLLTREDMVTLSTDFGGVVVVGSHTAKTTAQLKELLTLPQVEAVEFKSSLVLEGDEAFYSEVARCVAEEDRIIRSGKTAVCFTERTLLTVENDTPESALLRSVKISDGVQRLVGDLPVTPAFVIAKGGITSSDVGTKALKVTCARVMGQIRPGIPVWQTKEESRFPSTPYVIFPGNVGEASTLREAVEILTDTK